MANGENKQSAARDFFERTGRPDSSPATVGDLVAVLEHVASSTTAASSTESGTAKKTATKKAS